MKDGFYAVIIHFLAFDFMTYVQLLIGVRGNYYSLVALHN